MGRRCLVGANDFLVEVADRDLHHYDKMVNSGKVDSWTCVSFSPNLDAVRFCQELIDMCSSKGMVLDSRPLLPIQSAHPGQIEKTLFDIHAKSNARLQSMDIAVKHLQLLIIILPDATGSYSNIKRLCETELGIVSQCCQPSLAKRFNKQYLENLALKINAKVGGRNAVLEQAVQKQIPFLTDRPTMIFGADVVHPQPGEDSSPSIAAVVASMDWPEATKYRGLISAQPHRKEIIQDLYNIYEDPKKGIVHGGMIRNGVSEGQFNQVLSEEMDAIQKACVSPQEDYSPPVTFVVVQKRHHKHLFPALIMEIDIQLTGVAIFCQVLVLKPRFATQLNLTSIFAVMLVFRGPAARHITMCFMMRTDSQQMLCKR